MADKPEPRTRLEQAEYVVERVELLGISVKPGSRLWKMVRVLRGGHLEFDDPDCKVALQSMTDLYQLGLIVDHMDDHRADRTFLAKVKTVLKDAALPGEGNDLSPGRDTQFELYLAAVCIRAGLVPVKYDEPDVLCTANGKWFAIAAKRVKSMDRFDERVQDGIDQLARKGFPGIVAVDLTMARNPENRSITSRLEAMFADRTVDAENRELFTRAQDGIRRWAEGTPLRAILVFQFIRRVSEDNKSWIHKGTMFWFDTIEEGSEEEREIEAFRIGFKAGMPNLEDLTA
jgi:hypothetical protein